MSKREHDVEPRPVRWRPAPMCSDPVAANSSTARAPSIGPQRNLLNRKISGSRRSSSACTLDPQTLAAFGIKPDAPDSCFRQTPAMHQMRKRQCHGNAGRELRSGRAPAAGLRHAMPEPRRFPPPWSVEEGAPRMLYRQRRQRAGARLLSLVNGFSALHAG